MTKWRSKKNYLKEIWTSVPETKGVFIHLAYHVINKHQSNSVMEKSYVTCCEIRIVFLYNLALLWFSCTWSWSGFIVFQKCQPSSECVSPTKNTARTLQREEMCPNHWWVVFQTREGRPVRHERWHSFETWNLNFAFTVTFKCSSSHLFQKPQEEKYPVGPILLGLFIFVVCGSGEFIV